MVLFYSLVSSVMQRSSALLFNICVLTSDFYSMLAGIFLFGQEVRKKEFFNGKKLNIYNF